MHCTLLPPDAAAAAADYYDRIAMVWSVRRHSVGGSKVEGERHKIHENEKNSASADLAILATMTS